MANYDQLPFAFPIEGWVFDTDDADIPFLTEQDTFKAISYNNPFGGEEPIIITGYGYSHSG